MAVCVVFWLGGCWHVERKRLADETQMPKVQSCIRDSGIEPDAVRKCFLESENHSAAKACIAGIKIDEQKRRALQTCLLKAESLAPAA
jgi:hypothetical protein